MTLLALRLLLNLPKIDRTCMDTWKLFCRLCLLTFRGLQQTLPRLVTEVSIVWVRLLLFVALRFVVCRVFDVLRFEVFCLLFLVVSSFTFNLRSLWFFIMFDALLFFDDNTPPFTPTHTGVIASTY